VNHDVIANGVHVNPNLSERRLAGLEAVEIKHLADQRIDLLRLTENIGGVRAHLLWRKISIADQLTQTLYSNEGRASFVAHHGSERTGDCVQALERRQVLERS
jgi:hypothetical protein